MINFPVFGLFRGSPAYNFDFISMFLFFFSLIIIIFLFHSLFYWSLFVVNLEKYGFLNNQLLEDIIQEQMQTERIKIQGNGGNGVRGRSRGCAS
jgi:hypothetical protein